MVTAIVARQQAMPPFMGPITFALNICPTFPFGLYSATMYVPSSSSPTAANPNCLVAFQITWVKWPVPGVSSFDLKLKCLISLYHKSTGRRPSSLFLAIHAKFSPYLLFSWWISFWGLFFQSNNFYIIGLLFY